MILSLEKLSYVISSENRIQTNSPLFPERFLHFWSFRHSRTICNCPETEREYYDIRLATRNNALFRTARRALDSRESATVALPHPLSPLYYNNSLFIRLHISFKIFCRPDDLTFTVIFFFIHFYVEFEIIY